MKNLPKPTVVSSLSLLVLVVLFPLFFFGGADIFGGRIFKEIWNLGHVVFFGIFAIVILDSLKKTPLNIFVAFSLALLIVVCLAGLIEIIQIFLPGRTGSISDFVNGIVGGLFFLLIRTYPRGSSFFAKSVKLFGAAVLLMYSLAPFFVASVDEYRVQAHSTMLSDFESSFDLSRWDSSNRYYRVTNPVYGGRYSLKVVFSPNKYSSVALDYFPQNWNMAKSFEFHVFNPGEKIELHYRVHDKQHQQKEPHQNNRYNNKIMLIRGWNSFTTDIEDIANGPKARRLNLEEVRGVIFFLVSNDNDVVLYFDEMKLRLDE